jgi:hypothetical protein
MNDEQRKLRPTPAGLAFASRVTEKQFKDLYTFACLVDDVAEEARVNERKRIFTMSFTELCKEFWKGRTLHVKE